MRVIDEELLNEVSERAKASPRLRMNYDLRTQAFDSDTAWKDTSQRMLNVMMKDTVIPIHRHTETSETVIVLITPGRGARRVRVVFSCTLLLQFK